MCEVPDTSTLNAGHIASSDPPAGRQVDIGSSITLNCNTGWRFPDGNNTQVFNCTSPQTVSPNWLYCTGNHYIQLLKEAPTYFSFPFWAWLILAPLGGSLRLNFFGPFTLLHHSGHPMGV